MPAEYTFVSRWRVPAAPARCWKELERTLPVRPIAVVAVPWWHGVAVADAPERLEADATLSLIVRSPLGYRLRVRLELTDVQRARSMTAVSRGDLRGQGRLELTAEDADTVLTWRWEVTPERRWMRVTGVLLRPAFAAAHAHVMRRGARGFARAVTRG